MPRPNRLELHPTGERLDVDRVVTAADSRRPVRSQGFHTTTPGFLPVDAHGRVVGAPGVYAAGDATDFAIKQGGIACQQADAAAEAIAAEAGRRDRAGAVRADAPRTAEDRARLALLGCSDLRKRKRLEAPRMGREPSSPAGSSHDFCAMSRP